MPNPYVNKVELANGDTLIDISDTTAVASDVISGKYFYLASGQKVAGTGEDVPFFTVIWSDDYSSILSVTCNKTFSEIQDNLTSTPYAMAIMRPQSVAQTYKLQVLPLDVIENQYIKFFGYMGTTGDSYDLTYYANGTITPTVPSSYYETLTITSSGTYRPSSPYNIIKEVNVPEMESIPIFSVVWNYYTGTVSATCNKTFSECYSMATNYNYLSAVARDTDTDNPGTFTTYSCEPFSVTASSIKYCVFIYRNAAYDIEYLSNGTINVIQPSSLVSELPYSTAAQPSSGYSSQATITPSSSDQYLNIKAGVVGSNSYYKISAIQNGTAGTPTATKGAVSNHSVSVTPSVTNTTGYITGGTKTGTAVTVTASELASGNKAISSNGNNIDVVGYSTVSVAVPFSTITVSSSNPTGGNNGDVWIKTS